MKRLAKPREKRKSVIVTMKYCLDIFEPDPIETDKIGKLFRAWMRDHFSNWNESVLQYFLYDNNIHENAENDRFELTCQLDKIVKDDTIHSKEELDLINESIMDEMDDDAIDYSYKDTSSSESIRRPDLKESRLIKRLIRSAEVVNVSDPYFSNDVIFDAMKSNGYEYLLNDKEYKLSSNGTKKNVGFYGFWSKQIAGVGVDNPIIFYNELYQFNKMGSSNTITLLFSWKYDVNGNILNDIIITDFNMPASRVYSGVSSGISLSSGTNVIGKFSNYQEAYDSSQQDVLNNKNQIIV